MRILTRLLLVGALLCPTTTLADEAAARDVIASQLDAFQRDDFEEAFTYASPMIQNIFGTPERFGQMVQTGYPMVWRPAAVRFGLGEMSGDSWTQRVVFEDQAGRTHVAEYDVIETDAGWQINGVRLLPSAGVGT